MVKARYALRFETVDGTLEDAYHHMNRKAEAIAAARRAARDVASPDIMRVWVDDTRTELGIASFETRHAGPSVGH